MPDYSKSVIYKIYDNKNGDTYYGSTCNELRYRISQHKCMASKCKSKSIILNGDYSYCVVEEFPCESKRQLETRERWWIENNNCVNKMIPTRTNKEHYETNKDKYKVMHRKYYDANKETIMKKTKEWCENNKEHIFKREKQRREDNKDEIRLEKAEDYKKNKQRIIERVQKNYQKNKQQILERHREKMVCECGVTITKYGLKRHRETAKHLNAIACLPCPPPSSD
jgi:hypothetical protein